MKRLLLTAAVLVLASAPAFAGDEIMAPRFGNTTITKDASGREIRIYYAADHTLTGKVNGAPFTGTWKVDGGTVCITVAPPIPDTPNPTCVPVGEHKVGDTWGAGPYTVSLVAGIQ